MEKNIQKKITRMRTILSSMQVKLFLLVLLVFLPSFGLFIFSTVQLRNEKIIGIEQNSLSLAKEASLQLERISEGSRYLLIALSESPAVRKLDREASSALLSQTLKFFPNYANLFALTFDGDVFASAVPLISPVNSLNLPYFTETLKKRNFSFGDYRTGRITKKEVIVSAYPVFNEAGGIVSVVAASLDLEKVTSFLNDSVIHEKGVLFVLDKNGIILANCSHIGLEKSWKGESFDGEELTKIILENNGLIKEMKGPDGVTRIYSFVPVGSSEGKIFVGFGMSKEVAFASIDRELIRNITLFGLLLLSSFFVAFLVEQKRKEGELLLIKSENRYRSVINFSPIPMAINDKDSNIVFLNPAFIKTFGYTNEDIPTLSTWWEKAYPDTDYRKRVKEEWQLRLNKSKKDGFDFEPIEVEITTKSGEKKIAIANSVFFPEEDTRTNLVVLFDITKEKEGMKDLERKNKELDIMNEAMVGREMRIVELKEQLEKQKTIS